MAESKENSHSNISTQNRSVAQNIGPASMSLPAVPVLSEEQTDNSESVQLKAVHANPPGNDSGTGGNASSNHNNLVQFKLNSASTAISLSAPSTAFKPVQLKGENKTGLPDNLKSGVENLSGYSLNDVKVHYNSSQPAQLHALAYAQGSDIHVAPGQEKHLPHEAWHVVQQKQGRVQPTIQMKQGVPVNDDAGLEHEADVMGAKAVAQAKGMDQESVQLKHDRPTTAYNPVQRKAVVQREGEAETPEQVFQRENANMLAMISNSALALSKIKWHSLEAGTDNIGTGATITGLVGSATGGAGSATGAIQGTSKPDVSGAAGDITSGVGSAIGSLVQAVLAIKAAVTSEKKEGMLMGGGKVATAILASLKSGFEAAASIQKFVTGSVSPGIVSLIPGLGIAIAACEFIKNTYVAYNAYSAESEMTTVSGAFKDDLVVLLSGNPETQAPSLFAIEKRGKMFNRQSYTRLKPGLFEAIAQITDTGITADQRNTRMANFRRMHNLPATLNIQQFAAAIRSYEVGSKMQEINQKRKVQGARNIFTNLLSIAGEIAKFFPADGGVTAGVLLGASAGIGGVQAAGKFIQGLARDKGILGGDTNRSSASKHKEYVNHTKSIYEFLNNIEQPVTKAASAKVSRAESLIKATGANMETVYKTDYTKDESVTDQAKHIVEAMKAGR